MLAGMFPLGQPDTAQLQQWCKDVVSQQSQAQPAAFKPSAPLGLDLNLWAMSSATEGF